MHPNSILEIQDKAPVGREDDTLGIVQEIQIWLYYYIVDVQTRIYPSKWHL